MTLDDLPRRQRPRQWRWIATPVGVFSLAALFAAIALAAFLNRPQTVLRTPVTLLADPAADPSVPVISLSWTSLSAGDIDRASGTEGLTAGDRGCLDVARPPWGGARRYTLLPQDRC